MTRSPVTNLVTKLDSLAVVTFVFIHIYTLRRT
jgi:hypothetical protein